MVSTMNTTPIDLYQPDELAALLHFYAESGVEWLLEDEPQDRFAEFSAQQAARAAIRESQAPARQERPARNSVQRAEPAVRPSSQPVAIPDEQAVAQARLAAEGAASLEALEDAIKAFSGCNLKNSARNSVFSAGATACRLMIVGSAPSADDDREGAPFSGPAGALLDRMLAAIKLSRDDVLLTSSIPWRPPGDRAPSPAETDICRPFIERAIALVNPPVLLIMGNLAARMLFGGNRPIHALRGEWRDLDLGGARPIPAIATFHPQDLIAAPLSKRMAWQDLQKLSERLARAMN
jgi:uracil-DNA glycosylase